MTIEGTFDALKVGDKFRFAVSGKCLWEKISSSHAKMVDHPDELQIQDTAKVIKTSE